MGHVSEDEEEDEGLKNLPPAPRLRDREHERNSRRATGYVCDELSGLG